MMFSIDHGGLNDFVFPLFSQSPPKPKPHVTKIKFSETCSVVLIPCRQEYKDAKIDLWFNHLDYAAAEKERTAEVTAVMRDHPKASIRAAMAYLYQPRVEVTRSKPLSVLIVSEQAQKLGEDLQKALTTIRKGDLILHTAASAAAAKEVLTGNKGMDAILLSEQTVLDCSEDELLSLMNAVRQLCGYKVLVGVLRRRAGLMSPINSCSSLMSCDGLTSGSDDSSVCSIEASVAPAAAPRTDSLQQIVHDYNMDFIWREPIDEVAHMLPVLLEQQGKAQERAVFRTTRSPPPDSKSTRRSFFFNR